MALIEFLTQGGPRAHKHSLTWVHPISTFIVHYLTITVLTICAHDIITQGSYMGPSSHYLQEDKQTKIAVFTFIYFCSLISYRLILHRDNKIIQKGIVYEGTWLCNSTLYMATVGLCSDRHILVLSYVVTVSIDQVLWYVDLTGWVLSGFKKFPVGVAKYLTWPETSWATRITCTHHLWTIPLLIYACGGIPYPIHTFILSTFVMILNVSMSRWLTPFVLEARNKTTNDKHEVVKYLNVNLSHEVWKDITFDSLQIKHDNPPTYLYLLRLLLRWQLFNGIILFVVLCPISYIFFPL